MSDFHRVLHRIVRTSRLLRDACDSLDIEDAGFVVRVRVLVLPSILCGDDNGHVALVPRGRCCTQSTASCHHAWLGVVHVSILRGHRTWARCYFTMITRIAAMRATAMSIITVLRSVILPNARRHPRGESGVASFAARLSALGKGTEY